VPSKTGADCNLPTGMRIRNLRSTEWHSECNCASSAASQHVRHVRRAYCRRLIKCTGAGNSGSVPDEAGLTAKRGSSGQPEQPKVTLPHLYTGGERRLEGATEFSLRHAEYRRQLCFPARTGPPRSNSAPVLIQRKANSAKRYPLKPGRQMS